LIMKSRILLLCFLMPLLAFSQSIGGIINVNTAVINITGANIIVSSATGFSVGGKVLIHQAQGATVDTANTAAFGNILSLNGAGLYEFNVINAISGDTVTMGSPLANTYNTVNGSVQLVTVPHYCQATVTSSLTCNAWNGASGGILVLEAGTLTLNADIDVNGKGFRGGAFVTTSFYCSSSGFAGPFAAFGEGGRKGESISGYIANLDGLKGKQANGGGGSNIGNSGAGGGGNGGAGGIGGNEYSGCPVFDNRGLGGLSLTPSFTTINFGGGGGGGSEDNNHAVSAGANGGGIVYIMANSIVCNNRVISANGDDVTIIAVDEGGAGGGGGGTVVLQTSYYTGNLTVNTNGGHGSNNFNSLFANKCHGPGGGGGGGLLIVSGPVVAANLTYNANGGAAGLVNNPFSPCYNTTYGAAAGSTGTSLTNLPFTQSITVNSSSICAGSTATLIAGGSSLTYTWTASPTLSSLTSATVIANPVSTTIYTVSSILLGCLTSVTSTVTVMTPTLTFTPVSSTMCAGSSATLSVFGASSYSWSPALGLSSASGSPVIASPAATTVYSVTGTAGTCSSIATTTVHVVPMPVLSIATNSSSACGKLCVDFSETSNLQSALIQYSFGDGSTGTAHNPSHCYEAAGTYLASATITDQSAGCTASATPVVLTVYPEPLAQFTITEGTTLPTGSVAHAINTSTNAVQYLWSLCGDLEYTSKDLTTPALDAGNCCLSLLAISDQGCMDSVTKCIDVVSEPFINIPNVFTPNNDAKNDVFRISASGIRSFSCSIFDRWGLKMYEWNDVNGSWDGKTKNGAPAPDGSYFFIIDYTDADGILKTEKGFLSLFRN
jgi:gliding motility-associated-like protein